MLVVSFPEAKVPHDLRVQVMALQDQAWPPEQPSGPEPWHDPAQHPVSVLLLSESGVVVAALDILTKEISHVGRAFTASGISAMVTDEQHRGKGHGRLLAEAARTLMATNGADLGIFTCDTPLRSFYESAGWEHLPGTVLIGGTPDDPYPSDRLEKVTMASFFTPAARAARPSFVGARVELYSGTIDRLW
jgi:GNAT superfamily N-acetyltransferase